MPLVNSSAVNTVEVNGSATTVDEVLELVEDMSFNEQRTVLADLVVDESVFVKEAFSTEPAFLTLAEGLGVNDVESVALLYNIVENFSVSDEEAKQLSRLFEEDLTVDDVYSREFKGSRSLFETVNVSEGLDSDLIRKVALQESLSFNEVFNLVAAIKLVEDLIADDVYNREAEFLRTKTDSLALNDSFDRTASLKEVLTEDLSINEERTEKILKVLTEDAGVNEVSGFEGVFLRNYLEAVGVNDVRSSKVEKPLTDRTGLNDDVAKTVGKAVEEGLTVDEVYSREADLFRVLEPALAINDSYSRIGEFYRAVQQSFDVEDVRSNLFERGFSEAFTVSDIQNFDLIQDPGQPPYDINLFAEEVFKINLDFGDEDEQR